MRLPSLPAGLSWPRRSTAVLLVLFVGVFVLYLWVRPNPAPVGNNGGGSPNVPARTHQPTRAHPSARPPHSPSRTTTRPHTVTPTAPATPTPTGTRVPPTPTGSVSLPVSPAPSGPSTNSATPSAPAGSPP